jgi:hypothetical protein
MGTRLGLSGPMMDPSIYSFYEMMNDDVNPGTLSLPLSLPLGGPSLGPLWAHEEAQACAHHVPWEAHTRDHHGPVGAPGLGRSCGCVVVGVVVGVVSLLLWLVLLFFPIQVLSNDRSYRKKCATPIIQKQTAIHTDTHTHTHTYTAPVKPGLYSKLARRCPPASPNRFRECVRTTTPSQCRYIYYYAGPKLGPSWAMRGPSLCPSWARGGPKLGPIMGPEGSKLGTIMPKTWAHHGPMMGPSLGPSWALRGPSVCPSWACGGPSLGPSWALIMDPEWPKPRPNHEATIYF